MFSLPPIPDWDGLHPLIVHFPVALLLVAPILIIVGLLWKEKNKCFFISAFILMALGTIAAYIAVSTGEAAGELASRSEEINKAIESHEELAETARLVFTILSAIYLIIILLPKLLKKELKGTLNIVIQIVFLVLYTGGIIIIANTAHYGGILVHQLGVQAIM